MAKITTAIEIKRDIIRVLQLKKGLKEIKLVNYGEEKLPFVPSLEIEENINLISAKIRALFQHLPYRVNNPIFLIPTSEIMVRFFNLPYLGKAEREEAIRYEAQKYIPFPIDDIISDFYIPYEIKGREMRVVYTAVRNEMLTKYLNIASAMGLKPKAIEPYPFSLLRALFTSGDLRLREFVLIIDLDNAEATILVTQGLNLYIARDFLLPDISVATSQELLNKILFEINRTIDYMIKEFPHQPIKEVILTGEIADETIRDNLMTTLHLNVKLASLEGKIATDEPAMLKKYLGLLGAGLRGLISYDVDLEFFSDYQRKLTPKRAFSWSDLFPRELIQDILLILVGVLIANFYLKHQVAVIRKMEESTSLPELKAIGNKGALYAEIKNVEGKLRLFSSLLKGRQNFTEVLGFIAQKIPPGLWLDNFMLVEGSKRKLELTTEGYCYEPKGKGVDFVYDFLEILHNSEEAKLLFEDINITNLEKVKLGDFNVVKFKMSFILK